MTQNNFKEVLGQQVKKLAEDYYYNSKNYDIILLKIITETLESELSPRYKLR